MLGLPKRSKSLSSLSALIPCGLYHKGTTVWASTVPQSPALKSVRRTEVVLQRKAVCFSLREGQRPQERRSGYFWCKQLQGLGSSDRWVGLTGRRAAAGERRHQLGRQIMLDKSFVALCLKAGEIIVLWNTVSFAMWQQSDFSPSVAFLFLHDVGYSTWNPGKRCAVCYRVEKFSLCSLEALCTVTRECWWVKVVKEASVVMPKGKGSLVWGTASFCTDSVCCWNAKPCVYYFLISPNLMCHFVFQERMPVWWTAWHFRLL